MFKSETIKAATRRVAVGLGAMAGAALLSVAAPASASQLIYLQSATMVTTFQASISGIGNAYSNGVTFTVSDSSNGSNPYSLYGFCIDIYHHMYINTPLNYQYISTIGDPGQPLYTNYGPGPGNLLDAGQIDALTNLIDTGWMLHEAGPDSFDLRMRTAAI